MNDNDPYAAIAEWYDLEHDPLTDDIECYSELLAGLPQSRATLLEVGSGTGRILAGLAAAGYEVTGIEPSAAMRARCDVRISQLPQRVAQRLHVVAGMAEEMQLQPDQRYHAVIYGLNSFAHLTKRSQRQRALALARDALLPNGLLVIDLDLAGPRRLLVTAGQLYLQGVWSRAGSDQWVSHLIAGAPGLEPGTIAVTHFYDVFRSGEAMQRTLAQMTLALLSSGELELAVMSAGFQIEGIYGSYDLASYDDLAARAILVARYKVAE